MTALITEEQIFDDIVIFLEEDKEYWLRKRPEDKKNFRVISGEAAKGQKHVKSGGPFYLDPPRYPGNKGSPGLGLLEEQTGKFDVNTLRGMNIEDILQVVPKKDIEPLGSLGPTAFKAGTTYTIKKVKEDEFSINPPVMSRREFSISTFEKYVSPYIKPEEFDVTIQKTKEKKKLTKDTEITPKQQEKAAEKLTKKYVPKASEGFIQKIGDWFKGSAFIKTIGDVITWFKKLLGKIFGGGEKDEPTPSIGKSKTKRKYKPKSVGDVEITYVDDKRGLKLPSGEIRAGGTLAWLNNNPGNLKLSKAWKNYGAVGRTWYAPGGSGWHATFATYEEGKEALRRYLKRYMKEKTFLEFASTIYRPANPARWARVVARSAMADINDKMRDYDIENIIKGIERVEGYNIRKRSRVVKQSSDPFRAIA